MQRKRKGRMQAGEYMCAITDVSVADRSNKISKGAFVVIKIVFWCKKFSRIN